VIFEFAAQGDKIYVEAETEDQAYEKLTESVGEIPRSILTITIVATLPEGEEIFR
jgi:hypothetical protein